MNNPLVSVIVPVFNAEKYLNESINSIVGQTYENLEIILLPGNSTDNSTRLCNEWTQKDSRIRIVEQDVNCIGYARNKGIRNANGTYFTFCDSDDKMLPTFVEELLSKALAEDLDIVECEYYDATEDLSIKLPYETLSLTRHLPHSFYERFGASSVWRYIVKKEFWTSHNFKFPEAVRMEDLAVYSLLFASTDKTGIVYKPLYIYRSNPKSLMHTSSDIMTMIDNFFKVVDFMIAEFKNAGYFESHKSIIMSQLEYHSTFLLDPCEGMETDEKCKYQAVISNGLKERFGNAISVYDISALGWGNATTGVLCALLTKRADKEGRYIQKMTLRGMMDSGIKDQFLAICNDVSPNTIILDFLEECDYVKEYDKPLEEYLSQWMSGLNIMKSLLTALYPDAKVFIIEKYLAKYRMIDGQLTEFTDQETIDTFNELLGFFYKQACNAWSSAHFIPKIPDENRYTLTEDPKAGHNFDSAYYYEQIMDVLHEVKSL